MLNGSPPPPRLFTFSGSFDSQPRGSHGRRSQKRLVALTPLKRTAQTSLPQAELRIKPPGAPQPSSNS
ncbi:hypothetical protein E2C01_014236 [Portunus trituberculatus]|uniref:Uncharacterized protein n=1 Tax=Portunus trituberculatus TaxID=210409 RepID=A0A5B7DJ98_PORTR|nr:hypothetical protein [Portunus trituberculatus]